jgi:hypothetical protein
VVPAGANPKEAAVLANMPGRLVAILDACHLEGLCGKADFNQDGYIFIHELNVYAYLRVRQLSRGQQNPTTGKPPTIRSFALSRP